MGNSSSSNANHSSSNKTSTQKQLFENKRRPSPSPVPGVPHHSLRQKKKSLELPDLVSLSLTPANPQLQPQRGRSKTASIPIPVSPGTVQVERRKPIELPSTSSLANAAVRNNQHSSREAQQQHAHTERIRQQQQRSNDSRQGYAHQHIQELYNQSQQGPSHPRHFVQEVVRSSIPLALAQGRDGQDDSPHDPLEPLPVTVSWHGGGAQVYLARADDDNWNGRLLMLRESSTSTSFYAHITFPIGTHHLRFLVDGHWRVADDIPAAVDDQGSLANYVAIPLVYAPSIKRRRTATITMGHVLPSQQQRHQPGQSFWSEGGDDSPHSHQRHKSINKGKAAEDASHQRTHLQPSNNTNANTNNNNSNSNDNNSNNHNAQSPNSINWNWTNILPSELIKAAAEEEEYLNANNAMPTLNAHGHPHVTGFVAAPNIPPAPALPRHLEKLILNTRMASAPGSSSGRSRGVGGGASSATGRREDRERDRRGHREEKERNSGVDRERRERREKVRVPPPPPPSEDGGDLQEESIPQSETQASSVAPSILSATQSESTVPTSFEASVPTPNSASALNPPKASEDFQPAVGELTAEDLPVATQFPDMAMLSDLVAAPAGAPGDDQFITPGQEDATVTSPTSATESTSAPQSPPHPQMSQSQELTSPTSDIAVAAMEAALGLSQSLPSPGVASPIVSTPPLPNAGTGFNFNPGTGMGTGTSTPPSFLYSAYPVPASNSRLITIDTVNMPPLTDDASVLPVPSHVVLHHLSTSAIRNGVLAVGNTVRYKKKYLTTIYYKPT